jgi:hypothetical protein
MKPPLYIALCFIPLFLFFHTVLSQTRDPIPEQVWNFSAGDSSCFIDPDYFLPEISRDEIALKRYIRDPRFADFQREYGDTLAIDAIFEKAMFLTDDDIGDALLAAMFAAMDHFRLGLEIPLLGVLNLPLTFENDSTFKFRRHQLPAKVLDDSIAAHIDDRDKLQHFFGSAYLAYTGGTPTFAKAIGDFIEWGEPRFVVGGDDDIRDKYANFLGREFGMRLLDGEQVLPSDILFDNRRKLILEKEGLNPFVK